MDSWLSEHVGFLERGYRAISPFTLINAHSGSGSGELALELGVRGHAISFSTGSASGNDVIGFGLRTIRSDEVDVMVVGGTEAPILAPLWGAFGFAKVMSGRASDSNPAMRPFDKSRDGFLLGEGSAFVVMEELAHALGRGARIYAEVAGHGRTCEAYHSVAPHPDGLGLARAVEKALRDADVDQDDIEYVNTHGTATHLNDTAEAKALTAVFQRPVAVSSTKPVTGHLLAAAGALETVVCALALRYQVIPHTVNLADPIEETRNLDMVMHAPRPYPLRVVANTSVGFGGKNSCLILRSIDA
jgi:3-oxoacyl-[acyl-carrier-protein] synthase II